MPVVPSNGIEICYETFGDPGDPPVVLTMGLGVQMIGWAEDFCADLAARGHYVIRFDNRDAGESTHLHEAGLPDLARIFTGDGATAAYTLDDMAADLFGLIDALGLERVHLVGASLGGMICQTATVRRPERVASLTSIMSLSRRADWESDPAAAAALIQEPARDAQSYADQAVRSFHTIGSTGFPFDEETVRTAALRSYARAYDPAGVTRQLAAILTPGQDRAEGLARLGIPTLVIHGTVDPLIKSIGGQRMAEAIPGARWLPIEGMGHDLPRGAWPRILTAITDVVARGETSRAA